MDVINQRKYPAIDILKMYFARQDAIIRGETPVDKPEFSNPLEWNAWLTKCYRERDINALAVMRYRVQAGMDDITKKHKELAEREEIVVFYLRLISSIEKTARKILKVKYPNPHDNSTDKSKHSQAAYNAKKKRDNELIHFMHMSSY